jgi:hypothetical protein
MKAITALKVIQKANPKKKYRLKNIKKNRKLVETLIREVTGSSWDYTWELYIHDSLISKPE